MIRTVQRPISLCPTPLKDFDFFQTLFWIIPGTSMVLLRSFALRGSFPPFKKDDLATFVLGSVVYAF